MMESMTPEEHYGELFYDVHRSGIFEDGKYFADAIPLLKPDEILAHYQVEKVKDNFNLKAFVESHFQLKLNECNAVNKRPEIGLKHHLNHLWKDLERHDKVLNPHGSKIRLKHPYIVPGGRFDEIYYWDSYFTMLGLVQSGEIDMVEHMVNNFADLIKRFGHIPNGSRSYFLSRSQPPFFSLMVELLAQEKGDEIYMNYWSVLEQEYYFWMDGSDESFTEAHRRIVKHQAYIMNRYYDEKDLPREEMYADDWKFVGFAEDKHHHLFREIRAACESGWDFSSRWLEDNSELKTIQTTAILPVDLQCLLWHLESMLAKTAVMMKEEAKAVEYKMKADQRRQAIQTLFWNEEDQFFTDYMWKLKTHSDKLTLAGLFPLYFNLATEKQAKATAESIQEFFLHDGGLITSLISSNQQWDAPNGWAPLQWISIIGLKNFGFHGLAKTIAHRWMTLNESVFLRTGKMLEKYNVVDTTLGSGGGEYPVQDGFGWTNGVYLALENLYGPKRS